jgi:anti-sigma regulatory factor (Ser/Thr protein kinase)
MFICKVTDPGLGFDVRELRQLVVNPKSFNGRGIMIIKKLLDRFYYNEQGNSITLRKRISTL